MEGEEAVSLGPEGWPALGGGQKDQANGVSSNVRNGWRCGGSSSDGQDVRLSKLSGFILEQGMLSKHLGQEGADVREPCVAY